MGIRSTAKAIIVHDGRVLLSKCRDEANGAHYCLPGGGQEQDETLAETLVRECREETGYTVVPLRFAALLEEICDDPAFREARPDYAHKMLHIFICALGDAPLELPSQTDEAQIDTEWIDIDALPQLRLLPEALGDSIVRLISEETPLFLGSSHIAFNHG